MLINWNGRNGLQNICIHRDSCLRLLRKGRIDIMAKADDFSQLRAKCWGKEIDDEAQQWQKSHPEVVNNEKELGPDCYMALVWSTQSSGFIKIISGFTTIAISATKTGPLLWKIWHALLTESHVRRLEGRKGRPGCRIAHKFSCQTQWYGWPSKSISWSYHINRRDEARSSH